MSDNVVNNRFFILVGIKWDLKLKTQVNIYTLNKYMHKSSKYVYLCESTLFADWRALMC